MIRFIIAALSIAALAACSSKSKPEEATTVTPEVETTELAGLLTAKSKSKTGGEVKVTAHEGHVDLQYKIIGLKKNAKHGFHFHEKGDCSAADASSAGGHWNPTGAPHGSASGAHHAGDLGNIAANKKGVAEGTLHLDGLKIQDLKGLAIVVHAKPDDMKSQPAGNSGDRIACGVLH